MARRLTRPSMMAFPQAESPHGCAGQARAGRIGAGLLAFRPRSPDIGPREVGGGRATRQPGQVRKEAALTSTDRVARQPPTIFREANSARMRGRQSDGTMSETAKPTDQALDLGDAAGGRRLPRAGAQIPAGQLRRPDRPGRHGAHDLERVRERAHPAGLDPHRRARRRQDHDRAHPRPRAQLRIAGRLGDGADHQHAGDGRALPGDHREPPHRRAGDGRRLAQQRRGRAPDQRRHPLRAGVGALQGLHPRRSAHAVGRGVQRAAQDAGRAAAARQVHFRHHRNPQGAGDGAVALPALRSAPRRCRAAGQASRRHRRQGEDRGRAGGAGADRARGGRLGARFAVAVRPGDRACGGPGARRGRAADARPRRPRAHRRSVRGADEGRRRRRAQGTARAIRHRRRSRRWC